MKHSVFSFICFIVGLCLSLGSPPPEEPILQEIRDLKYWMSSVFSNQWTSLQKLRYQGVKSHKAIIRVYKELRKLSTELSKQHNRPSNASSSVCEKVVSEESKLPRSCPPPFEDVQEICVFIGSQKKTWNDSLQFCRGLGGDLFVGRNESTFSLLQGHLQMLRTLSNNSNEMTLWVGSRLDEGTWTWNTEPENNPSSEPRATVAREVWSPGEPRTRLFNPYPLCLFLDANHNFKGKSSFCRHFRSFICSLS